MRILFIRHGKTIGNLEGRYIGRTDLPLCEVGIGELKCKQYPDCDVVISSPMKRCLQTAEIIYPEKKRVVFEGLNECDFGDFEGKNYCELSGNPDYQKWIDTGGRGGFPGGEHPENFRKRCTAAFKKAIAVYADTDVVSFVVHGGTMMSVLAAYAVPKGDYFDFQIPNGCGYITEYDGKSIKILEQI